MNVPTVAPAPGRAVSPETSGKGSSPAAEGFATLMDRHLGGQDATDRTAEAATAAGDAVTAAAGAPIPAGQGVPSLVVPLPLAGGDPTGSAEGTALPSDAATADGVDASAPGLPGTNDAVLAASSAVAAVTGGAADVGTANAGVPASQARAGAAEQPGALPSATPTASPTTTAPSTSTTGAVAAPAGTTGEPATASPASAAPGAAAAGSPADRGSEAAIASTAASTNDAGAVASPAATVGAAGAAAASATSPGTSGAAVTGQVFPQIPALVSRGEGRHSITLRLHPADLGEVRVTVTIKNGAVDVTMAAGAEARQALRAGSGDLRTLLELAGAATGQVVIRDLPSAPAAQPSASTAFSMADNGRGDGAAAQGDADTTAGEGGTEHEGRGGSAQTSSGRSDRGPTFSRTDQPVTADLAASSTGTPAALDLTL